MPDPGPGPPDSEHVLTSTGYWGPILGGAVRLAEAGEGGRSMAQRVVNVLASLAVLNGLSADSLRSRLLSVLNDAEVKGDLSVSSDASVAGNVSVTGRLNYPSVGVRANNSGNITANAANTTLITLDSEDWDTNGFHTSNASSRFTVPTGYNGLYMVTGRVRWAATTTAGYRTLYLSKNANDTFASSSCVAIASMPAVTSNVVFDQEINSAVRLDSAGDYVQMFVGTSENTTITYLNLLYDSPSLEMHRVGV